MKPNIISYAAVLYVIAWIASPPLAYGIPFRLLAILAIFVILFSSLRVSSAIQKKSLFIALGLAVYMVGVALALGEDFNIKIGTIVILLTGVVYDMWLSNQGISRQRLKSILFVMLLLFCVWNTTTLYCIIFENARIMRDLTQNSDFSEAYALRGVGGFGYIYSVILMLPGGVELLRFKNLGNSIRLVNLYFVFTGFVLAYLSEYFIAMLLAILIIVLVWKRPGKSTYIYIGIIVSIFFFALEPILDTMIAIIDIPEINNKLMDMRQIMLSGSDIEDTEFGARFERYSRDVALIFGSPIWGTLTFNAVGKHSDFLDFFAQYGVPLGIIYANAMLRPAIVLAKRNVTIASVVLFVAIIMCLMNRFPINAAVPLCFFLPTYSRLRLYSQKKFL